MNDARCALALVLLPLLACETPPPSAPPPASSAPPVASAVPQSSAPAIASASASAAASAVSPPRQGPAPTILELPGAAGPISIDFIAYEAAKNRVWIPVNTGSVDVFDIGANAFARVEGFKTVEKEWRGQKRLMGPSAVFVAEGTAYVVNRGTSEVCPVDTTTLALGTCVKIAAATDVVAYVAKTKEVWVTTPGDQSIAVLDASRPSALKAKTIVKTDGETEAYAVDEQHGIFYTNLEDKDRTLAIDVKTRAIKTTVPAGCGAEGPRGLAVDVARGLLMVACTDGVRVLDAAHGLAPLARIDTGAGVDNVDYDPKTKNLMVAAGKVARLTVLHVDDKGQLTVVGTADTAPGARNAVADASGVGYVVDGKNAKLLVVRVTGPSP